MFDLNLALIRCFDARVETAYISRRKLESVLYPPASILPTEIRHAHFMHPEVNLADFTSQCGMDRPISMIVLESWFIYAVSMYGLEVSDGSWC